MSALAARRDVFQHHGRQTDIGKYRLAAQRAAWQQQMSRLQAKKADGECRLRRMAQRLPGGAIQARGHIHRHQGRFHGAQKLDRLGRQRARQASAKQRINHQRSARGLGFRESRHRAKPARCSGCRRRAGAGWCQGRHRNRPAGLVEVTRGDITITAIIARPGQH